MAGKQPANHFDLRYLRLYALAASAVAIIVGVFVLLGWMFDVSALKSVLPGKVTMKPNTALCFVLCGVALGLVVVATRRRGALNNARKRVALICSGLVAIIATVTLTEYLFTLDLKIDSLLFRNALLAETNNATGGRMAGATALAFAFLGVALMLRDARPRILRLFSEIFSLATLLVGMVAVVGYAYGIESLYSFYAYRSMAIHTAILFFVLGLASLFARPQRGLLAVITSDHGGGIISRRVLPVAVVLPFLLGWLRLAGQRAGLYGTEFGLALFATSNITIFAVIIWLSARSLNRIDAKRRSAGEELRASEERFHRLADAMPQIVWTSRADGWLDYYNQRWFDYTRMTLAQTEGSGWGPVLHPDDLQHCIDTWSESVRTGEPYEIKYRFRRASDGVYRWHLGRASAIHDEHGQIMKWFGTCTDIDDQKRAEEALELSHLQLETRVAKRTAQLEQANLGLQEQIVERERVEAALRELSTLMRTILDSANYAIISTDVDGTIRTFNKAAERLLGYGAEEMVGKQTPAILHDRQEIEDYARILTAELGTTIEPGFDVFVAKSLIDGVDESEWSYLRKDGSRFPVLLSVTALRDVNHKITGYVGVGSDISERKCAEEALRDSEERYRNLFENANDIVYAHDLEGNYTSVNNANERITGYTRDECLVMNIDQVIAPDNLEREKAALARKTIEKSPSAYELEIIAKDGHRLTLEVNSRLTYENGKPNGVQGIARDITERKRTEEIVHESEERFRQAFGEAPIGIALVGLDGRWLQVNRVLCEMVGYDEAELLAADFQSITHRDDLEADLEYVRRMLAGEIETYQMKKRYLHKQGAVVNINLSVSVVRDHTEQPLYFVAHIEDITERQRHEEALAISEKRYRELVDNGLGLICTHDLEGKLLSVNPAAADALGYTASDMVGKNLIDYIWPPVRAIFPHYLERVAAEPSVSGLMNLANKAGEERIWMYRNSRIAESGKDAFVLGFAQDVTEQKKIETELKQRELELVEAQHIALVGNWEWDIAVNKTSWSAALYSIYGIQPEDLIPSYEGYLNLVHPDDRERISGGIMKILRDRRGCSYEHRVIWPDKSIHHHHVNVKVALGDDGQPVKLFGTAQDITDRIYLENELKEARDAAIESARLKSEFLANMSHEIRTPMNGIIGVTELVMDTAIDDQQRRYMNTIKTSGESLMTIINDILDFSKIEAGMLNFETIDFDLRFTVESIIESMDERVRAKELEMALVFRPDVPTKLCGDPTRLRQILTNLLANAVKFTDWGKVEVRVSKRTEDEHRVTIHFDVRDTGIGIPEDAQKILFAPFVQADGSMTRRYGGTGLGLAISKQLVEMMGGTIGVKSEPGHGSTFTFAATFIKQASQAATAQIRSTSVDLKDVRVLIVDDNRTNRQILNGHMTSWGMITEEADNDVAALAKLRRAATIGEPFHLTLLDQEMPGVKGTELAKLIKTDPTIPELRLVLMPSYSKHGQTMTARDVGIDAYFTKPVRQSQLLECLLAVMSEARDSGPKSLITEHSLNEIKASLNRHILLVEDNEVNQTVALGQLAKLGYRVDVAPNGQEALDALGRRSYDAVLMDCHMPVMDGYTATTEIRKREGDSKHTPIIAMTAHAMSGDREKCLAAGMDSYLAKPVKRQALADLLEALFANGNLSDAPRVEEGLVGTANDSLPVDVECLKDAASDNPEKLKHIIDLYVLHTAERLAELKRAIKQEAAGDVHAIAHKCLGSSQTCGMTAIVPSIRQLERIGKEGDLSGAGEQLDAAQVAFGKIKTFLEEYVNSTIGVVDV